MLFSYWSFNELNAVLDDMGVNLTANALLVSSSPKAPVASTSLEPHLASTSLEALIASTSLEPHLASTSLEAPVASKSAKKSK